MAKHAAGHVLPSPLRWQDCLTSWSAFLPGSPAFPLSTGFFAQHPGLEVHVFFYRCRDSSSWELCFAPADTTRWHWKHCLFLSTNCMQTTQLPYSPPSLCLLRTANQVYARKIDIGHIWISSFRRDQRVRKEQEVEGYLCPLHCAPTSLTSEMAFLFTAWPFLYYVSIFCIPGPSVFYSHLKLCFLKAGYCQFSVSRSKKSWQRVWLKWVPQPSCRNKLRLCFCKTKCQGWGTWKGKQL